MYPSWLAGRACASVLSWCRNRHPRPALPIVWSEKAPTSSQASSPSQASIRIINVGVHVECSAVISTVSSSTACSKDASATYIPTAGFKIAVTCDKCSIIVANMGIEIKRASVPLSIPLFTASSHNPTTRYVDTCAGSCKIAERHIHLLRCCESVR
jgi:hypothetical protein